ncbi:MAG TPA: sigma-70 family RNA polymerase sigma factor [Thermoanaerobaculia bacterium]|nr:sigma-70 family RNA polymerase sigma factor [Thermoanaerobaculia bacterium]
MALDGRAGERSLLEKVSRGDADAFWSLWMMHRPHLLAVCYRQMRRVGADADDAVSRSMLVAHAKLPEYAAQIIDVEAWLTRLTCNVCLDIKKERCRGSRKSETLDERVLARREASLPEALSPEDVVLIAQIGNGIRSAIAELPPPLRTVAEFRFVQEMGYDVIAECLSITEANARKRVQQAREMLRPRLSHFAAASLRVKEQDLRGTRPQTEPQRG